MPDSKNDNGALKQIIVAIVIALVVGTSAIAKIVRGPRLFIAMPKIQMTPVILFLATTDLLYHLYKIVL